MRHCSQSSWEGGGRWLIPNDYIPLLQCVIKQREGERERVCGKGLVDLVVANSKHTITGSHLSFPLPISLLNYRNTRVVEHLSVHIQENVLFRGGASVQWLHWNIKSYCSSDPESRHKGYCWIKLFLLMQIYTSYCLQCAVKVWCHFF